MKIKAQIKWSKNKEDNFLEGNYSRVHQWVVNTNQIINISSSPDIVPVPMSDASLIDPEEALLASISSCHMLFFLSFCAKKKYIVNQYYDNPIAHLGKNKKGKMSILTAELNPVVKFEGLRIPTSKDIQKIHQLAHANCFIANSLRTEIRIN